MFRLALRQTEGLIGSVIGLLGLTLAVPGAAAFHGRAERDGCDRTHTTGRHLQGITEHGRAAWQKASGYTKRARVEGPSVGSSR